MTSSQNPNLYCLAVLTFVSINANGQILIDKAFEFGITEIVQTPEYGSGMSTVDFNQDGLDDITMTTNFGDIICYKNTGTGFELQDFGLTVPFMATSTLWVDYDNDQDLDVFISGNQSPIMLYQNDGDFNFQEVASEVGLSSISANYYGCSFADYDLDGHLDLYTTIYAPDSNTPFDPDLINRLYNNNGDGTFTDVTYGSQILAPSSFSFQANWLDYNLDGWPDLFVINDRYPANYLFINNGDGTFTEQAELMNVDFPLQDCMTNSICDFDQDGDMDIFITNTGGPFTNRTNIFAVNFGGFFSLNLSEAYEIDDPVPGWGGIWFDFNNDGSEDLLYVTEGDHPIYYYKNTQGYSLTQANELIVVDDHHPAYSPAKGDFNNDGYADIAIQCKAPNIPYLLMNTGGEKNFLKLTLNGTVSNTKAIGSWVKVYKNETTFSQYTHCGENYLGQNSQHLICGMNDHQTADSIEVIYPSHHKDTYYDVDVNQHLYLYEGETYSVEIASNAENSFCAGDSIELNAGNHNSYLWSNGLESQSIWVSTSAEYSVQVQNQYGIVATDTIFVSFNPNPVLSPTLTMPLCAGDSTGVIALTNLSEVALDSVTWSTGEVNNSLHGVPAGSYGYTCYDINGCSTTGIATLLEPSAIQFFASSTPELDDNTNGSVSISIFGGTPPYQIFFDGELIESPFENLESGTYDFIIMDHNSCTDSISILVDNILGIEQAETPTVNIFPNPIGEYLHIESKVTLKTIHIRSADGKLAQTLNPNTTGIYKLEKFSPGIYFLEIELDNHNRFVERLIRM